MWLNRNKQRKARGQSTATSIRGLGLILSRKLLGGLKERCAPSSNFHFLKIPLRAAVCGTETGPLEERKEGEQGEREPSNLPGER